jgi:CDP-diacylglycerol--glycerol-3-phosphate 3-phosphatidyltransferase
MANKITMMRILLLPLLVYFLYREGFLMSWVTLLFFIMLALTDLLDGYIARRRGEVTGTGKLLDPVADKMLLLGGLLPLIGRGLVPAWMGIVIFGREFLVNGLRMIAASENIIIAAGRWGKWKSSVYIVSICFVMGAPGVPPIDRFIPWEGWQILGRWIHWAGLAGLVVGMVFAAVSAVDYFRIFNPASTPPSAPLPRFERRTAGPDA